MYNTTTFQSWLKQHVHRNGYGFAAAVAPFIGKAIVSLFVFKSSPSHSGGSFRFLLIVLCYPRYSFQLLAAMMLPFWGSVTLVQMSVGSSCVISSYQATALGMLLVDKRPMNRDVIYGIEAMIHKIHQLGQV